MQLFSYLFVFSKKAVMKKVAIVLCLSTLVMLVIACGGKMVNRGHLSAGSPDELPIFLITAGNFREMPAAPAKQTAVVNDREQMPLVKVEAALGTALQYCGENYMNR